MIRAPQFWQEGGWKITLLAPLGALYGTVVSRRAAMRPSYRPPVPVVCVGNVRMGGAGKTPLCLALASALQEKGLRPHLLTRGYGGTYAGFLEGAQAHEAVQAGDEARLLAQQAPTWVGADRVASALKAVQAGADVLIMDDGFQNPALHKDFSLLVTGAEGLGNGHCFPAGPLRESFQNGLTRASHVVHMGGVLPSTGSVPVISVELSLDTDVVKSLQNKPLLAFAGLAFPEKFFQMLRQEGLHVVQEKALADHQVYTKDLQESLQHQALSAGLQLVTTSKDAIKWPDFSGVVMPLHLTAQGPTWEALIQAIQDFKRPL